MKKTIGKILIIALAGMTVIGMGYTKIQAKIYVKPVKVTKQPKYRFKKIKIKKGKPVMKALPINLNMKVKR